MKKYWILTLVLLPAIAWSADVTPYEWEKNRSRYALSTAEKAMAELVLRNHAQYEYVLEDKQFLMYSTIHRIVVVNNNEAIQKNNRIVVSMNNTIELVELKARAINKDGKVVFFDKNNLKELKDEESGNAYRIFAIEGVELGSEIEYYFTRKMRASLFDRTFMQLDVPIKKASFLLSCPKHLKFDFKTYHGLPAVKTEEKEETNVYMTEMADVQPMKKENFSFYDANRKRIEFKLAYNTARSQARLYTWDDAAKTFYGILSTLSKDDEKAIDKYLKTLGDKPSLPAVERIKNVEQKIKTTIQVNRESSDESLSKIESIVKFKLASREGITKLFIGIYGKLGINCQPVVTCSRENTKFDGEFDSWAFLDDYVLYFPDTKGFLAPYVLETRYPLIPPDFTAHQGLFIEPFTVGELKSALASVQEIPAADYSINADNLDIEVNLSGDLTTSQVHMKREFSGYNASFILPYFHLMTDEQRKNMVEEFTKQTAPDHKITTWSAKPVSNDGIDKFLVDVDFQSNHFLEKAGPRILFKVGQLIGPQVEMYRDDQRLTDVEIDFNHGYDRIIKVNLPAGYTIKNPQDLKFDVTYRDKENVPFLFQSNYTLEGSVLKIIVKEYYKQIYAPVSRYEDYRKVINAAADFNKVTLVFEKKK